MKPYLLLTLITRIAYKLSFYHFMLLFFEEFFDRQKLISTQSQLINQTRNRPHRRTMNIVTKNNRPIFYIRQCSFEVFLDISMLPVARIHRPHQNWLPNNILNFKIKSTIRRSHKFCRLPNNFSHDPICLFDFFTGSLG